ncbi:MAG: hypothetical protein PHT69_06095 [Bacteroidales bacterium]|nr:hypothetical protein [Bacteroidales bacterium]
MKKKLKNFVINISVLLLTFIIILVLLEVGLRIFGNQGMYTLAQYPKEMFDNSRVTLMSPNFEGAFPKSELKGVIKINSKGLRDTERPYEKNGKFRILGLGDSFPFGHGVELEESYLSIFEKLLNERVSPEIEIIKAGIPGTGPQKFLEVLTEEGMKYDPDMVILSFFVGNDIDDIELKPQHNVDTTSAENNEQPVSEIKENQSVENKSTTHYKDFLRRHVHLYSFIVDRLKSIPVIQTFLQKNGIASGLIGSYVIDILKKDYTHDYELKWAETFRVLDSVRTKVENIVILIVPTREQVDDERREKALKQLGYLPENIDIYKPNKILKQYCLENQIICIDMLETFRNTYIQTKKTLYFEIDPHFNTDGHKLASDILFEALSDTIRSMTSIENDDEIN